MDEQIKILSELKKKLRLIREKLQEITHQKQDEVRDINKLNRKYGYVEEILDLDLPVKSENIPFLKSLDSTANFVQSELEQWYIPKIQEDQVYYCINTSGTSIASSLTSYPEFNPIVPNALKQEINAQMYDEHKIRKEKITKFLDDISSHLKNIYLGAYENLDILTNDPERGAIGLMREIINQALSLLAADEKIREMKWYVHDNSSKTGITRKHRVRYIAENKSKNEHFRELIIKNIDIFDQTVNALNKYHKRGALDTRESRGFFYQAEELLEILCDSIDLRK